jgi:DNA topoisomerase VI subunit B
LDELALHILDIVENSTAAGATRIAIDVEEDMKRNLLVIRIRDNGRGMSRRQIRMALDPFYTTKKVRRVGLGLSMLAQAAHTAGGRMSIASRTGRGTIVTARFVHDHIDRQPLGDMALTIVNILSGLDVKTDLTYRHRKGGKVFLFKTRDIRKDMPDLLLQDPAVLNLLKKEIEKKLKKIA